MKRDTIIGYDGELMNTEIYFGEALIDPFALTQEQVSIPAIARRLSRIYRFGGESLCTVAEHSVNVSRMVPNHLAMAGLLHDAAEAYIGDCVRPLKQCSCFVRVASGRIRMQTFEEAENRILRVILGSQGIGYTTLPDAVKDADDAAMRDEMSFLSAADATARYMTPGEAEAAFMARYFEINKGRGIEVAA